MEKQKISFETAILAKKKGFNWASTGVYDEKGILGINHHDYQRLFANSNLDNWNFAAPTQSLLQKWLRDVHKIIVCVNIDEHKNFNWYWVKVLTHFNEVEKPKYVSEHDYINMDTYEEALESGLLQALNLI